MPEWNRVSLGEVLHLRKEFITIDDLTEYMRCRVQVRAQGIVLRDKVPGSAIKTKKQQVCRAGEFLVAEIDAKMGGFGLVPSALDGAVVSSHYFLFEIDESKLDRDFLDLYSKTPEFMEQVSAQGSTNYAAIRPAHVLGYTMPLPPLPEQQRIVTRIKSMLEKVEEVRELREQGSSSNSVAMDSARRKYFSAQEGVEIAQLRDYLDSIENGWSPSCDPRPASEDEWGVLKVGATSSGYYRESENKALLPGFNPRHEIEVRSGDLLMSRANTPALVGSCVIVEKTRAKLMLSDKIFRLVFRSNAEVDKRFILHALKSPYARQQIEAAASGTSPTMQNISKASVMALNLPKYDIQNQRIIADVLDELQARLSAISGLQAQTQREINALPSSILARAFAGEL